MATLEKIRSYSVLLVICIGGALLAFILGDLVKGGTAIHHENQTVVMSVNGEKIKIMDFERRVEEQSQRYKMQTGRELSQEDMQSLRNELYNTMIFENLLEEQTEKLGFAISKEEIRNLVEGEHVSSIISQNPLFLNPNTGRFDRQMLYNFFKQTSQDNIKKASPRDQEILSQYRSLRLGLENDVRQYRLLEKYNALLTKGLVANKLDVAQYVNEDANIANVAYVSRSAASIPDSIVDVKDSDLKKFYDEHKAYFKTPAYRVVDVIYSNIEPSQDDIDNTRADVEEAAKELQNGDNYSDIVSAYSDNDFIDVYFPLNIFKSEYFYSDFSTQLQGASKGDVLPMYSSAKQFAVAKLVDKKMAPDSVFVSHILLPVDAEGTQRADSLLKVIKADPSKFAELAGQYSLDSNSSSKAGELGWLTEQAAYSALGAKFADAVFAAQKGDPFKFQSQYGEHIILVDKRTTPIEKYKVAYVSKNVTPGQETYTKYYNEFSSFKASHLKENELDSAALNAGYQVLQNMRVYSASSNVVANIPGSRELVRWAFNNKSGEISDIKEFSNKYVFAIVKEEVPQGFVSFDNAKNEIRTKVLQEKKVDKMFADLESQKPASLEAYASSNSLVVDTIRNLSYNTNNIDGIGPEPSLNALVSVGQVGQLLPMKGDAQVYLLKVLDREKNPNPSIDAKNASDLYQANVQSMVRNLVFKAIQMNADIVDNRTRFY